VNTSNTLLRFAAGVVAVVVALRVAIDLLRPIAPWLLAAALIIAIVAFARWWRANRW